MKTLNEKDFNKYFKDVLYILWKIEATFYHYDYKTLLNTLKRNKHRNYGVTLNRNFISNLSKCPTSSLHWHMPPSLGNIGRAYIRQLDGTTFELDVDFLDDAFTVTFKKRKGGVGVFLIKQYDPETSIHIPNYARYVR